jgi:integrase
MIIRSFHQVPRVTALKWFPVVRNFGLAPASQSERGIRWARTRVPPFVLYTFRHTCITRWAKHMDPFTLHVLAGHTDMNTTKRYVHPSDDDIREAMNRVDRHAAVTTASQVDQVVHQA